MAPLRLGIVVLGGLLPLAGAAPAPARAPVGELGGVAETLGDELSGELAALAAGLVALAECPPRELPARAAALEARDALTVTALVRVVVLGAVPAEWTAEGRASSLDALRCEVLGGVLCAAPRELVRAELARVATRPFEAGERARALRLLGRTGVAADLRLALALAAPPEPDRPAPRAVREALAATLRALGGEPATRPARLAALWPAAHRALRATLVEVVASGAPAPALAALNGLLQRADGAELVVLAAIARAAERLSAADDDLRRPARELLDAPDAAVVRAAAIAVGRLRDDRAVPRLVALLGHAEPGVRRAARLALDAATGLALGEDPAPWRDWLAGELAWWRADADELLARLATGSEAEACTAVHVLARRRLFRGEIGDALARALARPEPVLVARACAALAHLGHAPAVPALVRALARPEPEVRSAALAALRGLTGEALPADPAAWRSRYGLP